jgi:hypothetical protein
MRSPLPVEISDLAAQNIRELESWWRRHRTAAPNAVRKELERALSVITLRPFAGTRAVDAELPDGRRLSE